jgi:hypothetical protein
VSAGVTACLVEDEELQTVTDVGGVVLDTMVLTSHEEEILRAALLVAAEAWEGNDRRDPDLAILDRVWDLLFAGNCAIIVPEG